MLQRMSVRNTGKFPIGVTFPLTLTALTLLLLFLINTLRAV